MTGDMARQATSLARAQADIAIAIGATPLVLRVLPNDARTDSDWCLHFELDERPLALRLSHAGLSALLRTLEPRLVLDPPPTPSLLALLCDTLLLLVAPAWERSLGYPVRFLSIEPDTGPSVQAVPIRLGVGSEVFRAAVDAGAAVDHLLAAWPSRQHALTGIGIPAWLHLGSTDLPIAVIRSLRPGDAVIVERSSTGNMPLCLGGGWSAPTRARGDALILLARPAPTPSDIKGTPMPASEDADLGSLPIRLDFDVGHRDLSLAELQALQPGAILSLGRPAAELVEIGVNGRRIGSGELVDVDGVAAVRITKLFGLA